MKTLYNFIKENDSKNINFTAIDDQWITDKMPVKTKDGRSARIDSVDISKVPNIIHGVVIYDENNASSEFSWEDTGKCIFATDKYGTPYKPSDDDTLVAAI